MKKPNDDDAEREDQRVQQKTAANIHLHEKFDDDINLTKLNQIKVMTQWRKIMRLVKTESLKKEIEILAVTQEKCLTHKDAIIQFMLLDLKESENQIAVSNESQSNHMKEMISIHTNSIDTLETSYKEHINLLTSSFTEDMNVLDTSLAEEMKLAEGDEQAVLKQTEQNSLALTRSFQRQEEDYQRQQKEEIESLRSRLEDQIESLKTQFDSTQSTFHSEFGALKEEYKEMLVSDKLITDILDTRKKQVDNLQMLLFQWQGKMKQLMEDSEDRKRVLIAEKRNMHNHYQALKARIKAYRTLLTQRLTELSARAHECKKRLNTKLEVGKKVLAAAKATHDWHHHQEEEDEEEDITITRLVDLEEDTDLESCISNFKSSSRLHSTSSSSGDINTNIFEARADTLNNFYDRYNKLLAKAAIDEEQKNRLREENSELQDLLIQYEKASTFSGESVQGNNSLLIVNGRSNIDTNLLHLTGTSAPSLVARRHDAHRRHK